MLTYDVPHQTLRLQAQFLLISYILMSLYMQIRQEDGCTGHMQRVMIVGLVIACVVAYLPGLFGEFVGDSGRWVDENPHIQRLWPLSEAASVPLWSERGALTGRPVLGLSLALNRAVTGSGVWGYRLGNLVIHTVSVLLLFAFLRLVPSPGKGRRTWAFATALLWAVHPLATAAVTCVIGRAESLMALFFLLTLYSVAKGRPVTATIACAIGMATNGAMVMAPLVVLLYDALFAAGSVNAALRERRRLYLGLASTWLAALVLLALTAHTGPFAFGEVSPLRYLFTQAAAVWRYVKLGFWPVGLAARDATRLSHVGPDTVMPVLAMMAVAAVTLWGFIKRRPFAFFSGWVLLTLVPASSFIPRTTDTYYAESRFYLPLVGLVGLVTMAGEKALHGPSSVLHRRKADGGGKSDREHKGDGGGALGRRMCFCVVGLVSLGLMARTVSRNWDYRSRLAFWSDNAATHPTCAWAHREQGLALLELERAEEALAAFETAVDVDPDDAESYYAWGEALLEMDRPADAAERFKDALRIEPLNYHAICGWGMALAAAGEHREAVQMFEQAVELEPGCAMAYCEWGDLMRELEESGEARALYAKALEAEPMSDLALMCMGKAMMDAGKPDEAIDYLNRALALSPENEQVLELLAEAEGQE